MGLSTVLIALLLPAFTPQQGPPGGTGGGWVIDYQMNGITMMDYSAPGINPVHQENPWDMDPTQWRIAATMYPMMSQSSTPGFSASGSLEGTVKVRVRWTGGGTAPNHVWLAVDSSATWTGDSGSSDNGQGDPEVALQPGPGKRSEGIHVIRKPYSGQPIIFELAFSSTMQCSTIMTTYAVQATLNVTVTDRSAMLARGDGGTATLEDGTYTAHTLLSWSGTHDGVNYDELPDGGPGITSQILTGTASGSWKNKPFTNPQTQQTYTTKDLTVNWGGSTTGTVSLTPPNPLEVFISTYQGNMPQFDPEGTSPKEETWTYKVKDNQDGITLDLKWNGLPTMLLRTGKDTHQRTPASTT